MRFIVGAARLMFMIALSLAAGAVGSAVVRSQALEWYGSLVKPLFSPAPWVFGIAWLVLYILMGIAAGLVWNIPVHLSRVRRALVLFFIQLVLNVAWVILFFGFRLIGWALLELLVLWTVIVIMEVLFYTQSKTAGKLLWPYVAWLTFAVYLNAGFWVLNH